MEITPTPPGMSTRRRPFNVSIRPEVTKQVKAKAAASGASVSRLVEDFLIKTFDLDIPTTPR